MEQSRPCHKLIWATTWKLKTKLAGSPDISPGATHLGLSWYLVCVVICTIDLHIYCVSVGDFGLRLVIWVLQLSRVLSAVLHWNEVRIEVEMEFLLASEMNVCQFTHPSKHLVFKVCMNWNLWPFLKKFCDAVPRETRYYIRKKRAWLVFLTYSKLIGCSKLGISLRKISWKKVCGELLQQTPPHYFCMWSKLTAGGVW